MGREGGWKEKKKEINTIQAMLIFHLALRSPFSCRGKGGLRISMEYGGIGIALQIPLECMLCESRDQPLLCSLPDTQCPELCLAHLQLSNSLLSGQNWFMAGHGGSFLPTLSWKGRHKESVPLMLCGKLESTITLSFEDQQNIFVSQIYI